MDASTTTAEILRLVDTHIEISQVERVSRLLLGMSASEVAKEGGEVLAGTEAGYFNYLDDIVQRGYQATNILSSDYPHLLREVREAPAVVFTEGTQVPSEVGVSIVGSRNASLGAQDASYMLASALSAEDVPVISGLARGIDGAAHEGALDAGGRTVAIIGTGLDVTYPPEHSDLRKRIASSGGLVLSQFRLGTQPQRKNFPMRNAVMSGYGVATIVMAAAENSGTKHQVTAAVKHGRQVVFAGKVAENVSWAKSLISRGQAVRVHSLDEAVDTVMKARSVRRAELSLF